MIKKLSRDYSYPAENKSSSCGKQVGENIVYDGHCLKFILAK